MKLVSRAPRTAGYALAILFLALWAVTSAMAQAPDHKYSPIIITNWKY